MLQICATKLRAGSQTEQNLHEQEIRRELTTFAMLKAYIIINNILKLIYSNSIAKIVRFPC